MISRIFNEIGGRWQYLITYCPLAISILSCGRLSSCLK